MGVRFVCHSCGKRLHVKSELAGKRGVCPDCNARFRVPSEEHGEPAELTSQPVGPLTQTTVPATPKPAPSETTATEATPTAPAPSAPDPVPAPTASPKSRRIVETAPEATWYVRPPSGGQYGPASSPILENWIGEGRVSASALVWRDGWPQWREAREVLGDYLDKLPQEPLPEPAASGVPTAASGSQDPVIEGHTPKELGTSPESMRGDLAVGRSRRAKAQQRAILVSVLAVLSVLLILALVIVASR